MAHSGPCVAVMLLGSEDAEMESGDGKYPPHQVVVLESYLGGDSPPEIVRLGSIGKGFASLGGEMVQ